MSSRSRRRQPAGPAPDRPAGVRQRAPRGVRLAWVAACLVAVAVAGGAGAFVRVAEGERAFRAGPGGGPAERLAPGRQLRIPFVHRVVIFPPGRLQASGSVSLRAREGIDLELPFEVSGELSDPLLAELVGDRKDPASLLERTASDAIAAWGRGASGEAIVLLEGSAALQADIVRGLEREGFDSAGVRFGKVRGPSDAIAAIETRALRERVTATGVKVAIIGLDGADWEIIDPLIAAGRLPVLARLKQRGAWGNMKTMSPALSPLLWTTVATGKPPEQHGIIDFLVKDPQSGEAVPVSSRARKVKALWNIYSDVGRTSAFVAWWATWPAEPINGLIVSDRVAYSLFGFEAKAGDRVGATHPASYYQDLKPLLVDDWDITLEEVQRFAHIDAGAFQALRGRIRDDRQAAYREPVNHLTKILASTRTYHAAALDVLRRGQPDLFSVYYQGIDEVGHRFAHYMPPKMGIVTDEEFARYQDAVAAFYRLQDELIGQVLAKLSPDTTVILLSDHGFKNGTGRPNEPPYIEGKPGLWHRRYGILALTGPAIRPGRLDTSELVDVAPTVLYLSGLPVPEDMEGRVLDEAIDPAFLRRFRRTAIPTYESVGRPLSEVRVTIADSGADAEMVERLRSLGYLGGGTDGGPEDAAGGTAVTSAGGKPSGGPGGDGGPGGGDQTLVTGHLNEAGLYLKNKDYRRADEAVRKALRIAPEFMPALMVQAQIEAGRKSWAAAIAAAKRIIALDPKGERGVYTELGRIYTDSGRIDEGVAHFRSLLTQYPDVAEIHGALGAVLLRAGRTADAEQALLEAIRIDPALGEPLADLHTIYRGTDRVLTLEPIVRKGLEINGKSIVHHNWMGLIYEWKRDLPRAESEFRAAMELDPDYAATMANLGALYGRSGRLKEAVEVLNRAVTKDPENVEAWINLGAALGRLGRSREAIDALETARRKGVRTTTLFNALALTYLQEKQRDKALEYLNESLAIDPAQQDARELLDQVRRSP